MEYLPLVGVVLVPLLTIGVPIYLVYREMQADDRAKLAKAKDDVKKETHDTVV